MKVAERHVDSAFCKPACLRNAVTPAVLAGSAHDHQATVFELETMGLFPFDPRFAFEQKAAGAA